MVMVWMVMVNGLGSMGLVVHSEAGVVMVWMVDSLGLMGWVGGVSLKVTVVVGMGMVFVVVGDQGWECLCNRWWIRRVCRWLK